LATQAKTTHLYLVRHGATAANDQRPYVLQGSGSDLPLNAAGQRQAADVARNFASIPIECVYASPLVRAVETATAIADAHRLPVTIEPALVECNVGQWEGLSWGTIAQRFPFEYASFVRDSSRNPYLGGETFDDVLRRIQPAFERILRDHAGRHVVVVAHAVVNRVFLAGLLGLEIRQARIIPQDNGCVNLIRGTDGQANLVTLNSIHHLALAAA
jgi:broad specificity phosphatase PhoE